MLNLTWLLTSSGSGVIPNRR